MFTLSSLAGTLVQHDRRRNPRQPNEIFDWTTRAALHTRAWFVDRDIDTLERVAIDGQCALALAVTAYGSWAGGLTTKAVLPVWCWLVLLAGGVAAQVWGRWTDKWCHRLNAARYCSSVCGALCFSLWAQTPALSIMTALFVVYFGVLWARMEKECEPGH